MTGAIALAIVMVVAVIGVTMAMESQRAAMGPQVRRPPRQPAQPGPRRARERKPQPEAASPPAPPSSPPPEARPELLRTGVPSDAKVISVVDERTIGPVTRSRLVLQIEPAGGSTLEVTVRVSFQTPESRADVKVGGIVRVRYDKDDPTRVVVDLPNQ